ncbi:protein-glutamate O-methyltransferase [bacterium]|nr:protein-glutamate O-methyltransferase [bacterium]
MDCMSISMFRRLEQQAINQQYREIYSHELAHKNAAGSLAGSIVIEKDSNGIPVGGHVSIKMPRLNPNNPDETINHANRVIKAALAPSDPSEQDYKVAFQAKQMKTKAEQLKVKKGLDYYA